MCAGPWGVVNLPARRALVPSPVAPAPPVCPGVPSVRRGLSCLGSRGLLRAGIHCAKLSSTRESCPLDRGIGFSEASQKSGWFLEVETLICEAPL